MSDIRHKDLWECQDAPTLLAFSVSQMFLTIGILSCIGHFVASQNRKQPAVFPNKLMYILS